MSDPLAPLLADGVIDEVCARLKSGKEADLWLVRHGAEIVAAKVYKARETRSFHNDAAYREGRRVRNTRTQRAMDRGSRFGQAAAEDAWKAKEADALHALHAAGVRVPRPVMFYEGVLLMELVVDAHGHPAPRLVDAPVAREQAAALYADLRAQAVRMLCCDLVHGDLSPYNVLLGRDGPVVIDFPQVVGAAHNSQAEAFFVRDLENLRRHLAGIDPALRAAGGDAREIWHAYVRRELTPDYVPTGRAPEPARRGGEPRGDRQARRPHPEGWRGDVGRRDRAQPSGAQSRPLEGRPGSGPARPPQAPGRLAQGPARSSQGPGRPAQGRRVRRRDGASAAGDPARPPQGTARPPQGSARSSQGPARPPQGSAHPPQGPARPAQGSARPAQGPRHPEPRRERPSETPPGRGADPRASRGQGARGQRPQGRDRRAVAGPEVIRVVRPPLGKPGDAQGAPRPATHPRPSAAHGGQRPQERGHDPRRRRR